MATKRGQNDWQNSKIDLFFVLMQLYLWFWGARQSFYRITQLKCLQADKHNGSTVEWFPKLPSLLKINFWCAKLWMIDLHDKTCYWPNRLAEPGRPLDSLSSVCVYVCVYVCMCVTNLLLAISQRWLDGFCWHSVWPGHCIRFHILHWIYRNSP